MSIKEVMIDNQTIIGLYTSGSSTKEVADEVGVSRSKVYDVLRQNGIPLRAVSELEVDEVIKLYKNHKKTLKSIEKATGQNSTMIYKILKKHEIPLKNPKPLVKSYRVSSKPGGYVSQHRSYCQVCKTRVNNINLQSFKACPKCAENLSNKRERKV